VIVERKERTRTRYTNTLHLAKLLKLGDNQTGSKVGVSAQGAPRMNDCCMEKVFENSAYETWTGRDARRLYPLLPKSILRLAVKPKNLLRVKPRHSPTMNFSFQSFERVKECPSCGDVFTPNSNSQAIYGSTNEREGCSWVKRKERRQRYEADRYQRKNLAVLVS
jgi:hypothetical protein